MTQTPLPSPQTSSETAPDDARLSSPAPFPAQPPSLDDLLDGLSSPLAAPRLAFVPASTNRLMVSSDPSLLANLLHMLQERSGIPQAEVARRMAVKPQSLNQYLTARRANPHILWVAKFVEALGARLVIEFPSGR